VSVGVDPGIDLDEVLIDHGGVVIVFEDIGEGANYTSSSG
jgi:hypothetical protein